MGWPGGVVLVVPTASGDAAEIIGAVGAAIDQAKARGFQIALDGSALSPPYATWLPVANFVKLDIRCQTLDGVASTVATLPNTFNVDTGAVLAASEAKLWIDQDTPVLRRALRGEQVQPELLVEPWLRSATQEEFVVIRGKRRFKANAGVLAPIPARLAFRSAWWSDSRVVADPDKLERSRHLHIYGFA